MLSWFFRFSRAGGLQFCPSRPLLQAVPSFLFTTACWTSWWFCLKDVRVRYPSDTHFYFAGMGAIFCLPTVVFAAELLYLLYYWPAVRRERLVREVMES